MKEPPPDQSLAHPTASAEAGTGPTEAQIAAGLADLRVAADLLRSLDLDLGDPGLAFDAAWEPEPDR